MSIDWSKVKDGTPILYTTTNNWDKTYDLYYNTRLSVSGYIGADAIHKETGRIYEIDVPIKETILYKEILFKETM